MADTLTQLQQCLDQLNTQLYATLRYINTHHSAASIPAPTPPSLANGQPQAQSASSPPPQLDPSDIFPPDRRPDSPTTFAAAQKELAHDLVLKSQQIDGLVKGLPGVERGKEEQESRIKELEEELKGVIAEWEEVEVERRRWIRRVEDLIVGVRR